ncbi:MAG: L,D-transpeptidase [Ktedonobacterales bacterium]
MRQRWNRVTRYVGWRWSLVALAGVMLLAACAGLPSATAKRAPSAEQTRLDQDIAHARDDLGVPAALLQPILDQERQAAKSGQRADAAYSTLDQRVLAVETTSLQTLKTQTANDVESLSTALARLRTRTTHSLDTYQSTLIQAVQSELTAVTPGDYATIDVAVRAQLAALAEMPNAQQRLVTFGIFLATTSAAGTPVQNAQALAKTDAATFDQASSTSDFTALELTIDQQTATALGAEADGLRTNSAAMLKQARADIATAHAAGINTAALTNAVNQDATQLALARTREDYLKLAGALNGQLRPTVPSVLRAQANADARTLAKLIAYGQTQHTLDPFTKGLYPAAYEYANAKEGIGLALGELNAARTVAEIEQADTDINILTANLQAMLDNMKDPTPAGVAHKAELRLLNLYGLTSGKVMVVSLREQVARLYVNGTLIAWSYVTTGRPERPSPPGLHYAMKKYSPAVFTSNDPPGSPFWYAPTPVKYAISYADGGFFLHDGWWRVKFGPGTNLPHYAPIAFNGGSHGCINFPKEVMGWIYDWMTVGTPVLVY